MDFEEIKAHLDRLFSYRPAGSTREQAASLREALIDIKVAKGELLEALGRTEAELKRARTDLADSKRRRGLAEGIEDQETVRVADEHLARVLGRVDLLERKVLVQRDEMAMVERDYQAVHERFRRANAGLPSDYRPEGESLDDPDAAADTAALDRERRDAAVEEQLKFLKKKLGRE